MWDEVVNAMDRLREAMEASAVAHENFQVVKKELTRQSQRTAEAETALTRAVNDEDEALKGAREAIRKYRKVCSAEAR